MIIDISPTVHEQSPVWPGDVRYSLKSTWSLSVGDTVSVAEVRTTTHIGAHIDAPSHVLAGAPSIEATPLAACVGPCLVVDVSALIEDQGGRRAAVGFAAVRARIAASVATGSSWNVDAPVERLLLRHAGNEVRGSSEWDDAMPGLDPELVQWFGEQGGKLLGIDLASFDQAQSTELPAHRIGFEHGIVLLEGLELSEAPEGVYELIALPLPWRGADASPVRAILRTTEETRHRNTEFQK